MLIFGGEYLGQYFEDLWLYSMETDAWSSLGDQSLRPEARSLHSAIWDPNTRGMVIFAGQGSSVAVWHRDALFWPIFVRLLPGMTIKLLSSN